MPISLSDEFLGSLAASYTSTNRACQIPICKSRAPKMNLETYFRLLSYLDTQVYPSPHYGAKLRFRLHDNFTGGEAVLRGIKNVFFWKNQILF